MAEKIGRVTPVRMVVTALGAIVATGVASAIWGGLLTVNLSTSPGVPWSAPVTWLLLWLAWRYAGGDGPPAATRASRRRSLRGQMIDGPRFALALAAGGCALIALIGLWIVLFQTGAMQGNRVPDFAQYPMLTVVLVIATAAAMGAITEEGAFRGYVQGLFERRWSPAIAIGVTALLLAPGHAATQGFALPTFAFYLLVDLMLGTTAYLCESIVPGVVIHAAGLAAFFGWIWPNDATRVIGAQAPHEAWFWVHVVQIAVFGAASILAYRRLAAAASNRQRSA
jgi:membrane protease YdiL (CAAX protease family)